MCCEVQNLQMLESLPAQKNAARTGEAMAWPLRTTRATNRIMEASTMQRAPVPEDRRVSEPQPGMVDMERELSFWRRTCQTDPEAFDYIGFMDVEPALRLAVTAYLAQPDADFEDLDPALARTYRRMRGVSSLSWYDVHGICRRAFLRLQKARADAVHR
jgi:hypothetical protein